MITRPSIFSFRDNQQSDPLSVILDQSSTGSGQAFTQAIVNERVVDPFRYTAGDQQQETYISFLHRAETPETFYAIGLNSDLSGDFGALSFNNGVDDAYQTRFSQGDLFTTPILGYSSLGSSLTYGWNNSEVTHKLGLSVIDEQQENGQVSNSILYESSVQKEDFRIGLQMGALIENDSLLGGASDSALGVDSTSTYYLGLNGSYNLSKNITLLGGYFQGLSSIDERRGGLLGDFSNLRSEGYAVGLLVDNMFSPKGRFGMAYSSPIQTIGGSATLTLPVSQNSQTGNIGFESSNISYEDGDNEKVFEAYYDYRINRNSSVFTHLSYTKNPLSNIESVRDRTIFIGYKHKF